MKNFITTVCVRPYKYENLSPFSGCISDFYAEYTNDDTAVLLSYFQKALNITVPFSDKNVVFAWNIDDASFRPIKGDYEILGTIIPIRQYTWKELSEICFSEIQKFVTLSFDCHLHIPFCERHLLGNIEYREYIDYSATITELEKQNLVKTRPSTSCLATDNRCFSFSDDKWWEVDLLGTFFGDEITEKVLSLFENNIKQTISII